MKDITDRMQALLSKIMEIEGVKAAGCLIVKKGSNKVMLRSVKNSDLIENDDYRDKIIEYYHVVGGSGVTRKNINTIFIPSPGTGQEVSGRSGIPHFFSIANYSELTLIIMVVPFDNNKSAGDILKKAVSFCCGIEKIT